MDEVISSYNIGRRLGVAYASYGLTSSLSSCSNALSVTLLTVAQEAYYRGFIAGWWESFT